MKIISFSLFILFIFLSCLEGNESGKKTLEESPVFPIATQTYLWTDSLREDEYYGGKRIVNTRVWYPSTETNSNYDPTPYYFRLEAVRNHLNNWGKSDLELLHTIKTKSVQFAPIKQSSKKYPLIVFSPSLSGNLSQYTHYAERLAQEGYIVMGINHLHESEYVIAADGTFYPSNLTFHDSLKTLDIPNQISADEYRRVKGIRQKVLGEDVVFSINQLLKEDFFEHQIDLSRIGAFGHSIGGTAVVYARLLDDRIKTVINLDGTPPTVASENGISVPFLFIEDLTDYKNHAGYAKLHKRRNDFCKKNKAVSWRILIANIGHNSFLDINYHFASTDEEKANNLKNLNQIFDYMSSFFAYSFDEKELVFSEMTSDTLEIIQFGK